MPGLRSALLTASVMLLVACGDGGGGDQASNSGAPTISGTPQSAVLQNTAYLFQPSASDPNGDKLTFSISGKPAWASFDPATGKLSGTPTPGDVATYANIVIGVSDGTNSTNLSAFSISVVATATGAATLTWTPPTTYTDGSALTVAGYRIYWGTSQNNYTNSKTLNGPGFTSAVIDQLVPATYYFAVTAFDANNMESTYSNVATKQVM